MATQRVYDWLLAVWSQRASGELPKLTEEGVDHKVLEAEDRSAQRTSRQSAPQPRDEAKNYRGVILARRNK